MITSIAAFEKVLTAVDNTIAVNYIETDNDTSVIFRTCDTKWLMVGQIISDVDQTVFWEVTDIVNAKNVYAKRIEHTTALTTNQRLLIPMPVFKSGTHLRVNTENKILEKIKVLEPRPWVWLRETIDGEIGVETEWSAKSFDFTFYSLYDAETANSLNVDRHQNGTYFAAQFVDAVIEGIDDGKGMVRRGRARFREFNLFGKEEENGMIKHFLDASLSGVECRVTVEFDKNLCKC